MRRDSLIFERYKQIVKEAKKGGWWEMLYGCKFTGEVSPDGESGKYTDGKKTLWADRIGIPHNNFGPAEIDEYGKKLWKVNGILHREDGPAVIIPGVEKQWYVNGELHRLDGPAIENNTGSRKEWYVSGKRHRLDGPAIVESNGRYKEWYIDGKLYETEEQFDKKVKELQGHKSMEDMLNQELS